MRENIASHVKQLVSLPIAASLFPVVTLLFALVFYSHYLSDFSQQVARDFKAQNQKELANEDIYGLTYRLNQLSSGSHIVCVSATRRGHQFFSKSSVDQCDESSFVKRSEIESGNKNVKVELSIRLPRDQELAFIAFVVIQVVSFILYRAVSSRISKAEIRNREFLVGVARQVAHDIRSPLSALNLVVRNTPELDEDRKLLIENVAKRINSIANELLDVAKGGQKAGSLERVNLKLLLANLIKEKRAELSNVARVELVANFEKQKDVFALVNKDELARVISNLINNSVEAINEQGKIEVGIADEKLIALLIKDNGKGIHPDAVQAINRGDFASKSIPKSAGSGLGLSHARSAILAMNGSLEVRSVVGVGSEIHILLPRA